MRNIRFGCLASMVGLGGVCLSGGAHAAVVISTAATQNMNCSAGVCMPTTADAVLNAGDLERMLASGSITVTTTGSGVQAKDIAVKAPVSWNTGSALTLDAYRSLTVERPVAVRGFAALNLTTNDGGTGGMLSLGKKGSVTFANLSSALTINGTGYTLEDSISSLAPAIAANPSGAFALANSYDASQDGTYTTVPIPTPFTGTFEGLGNDISKLSINDGTDQLVGLFAEVDAGGTLRDIGVVRINISNSTGSAGPLAGYNAGMILHAFASGQTTSSNQAGGLVGANIGTISFAAAATRVDATNSGGLVGTSIGTISESYATGKVSCTFEAGGLIEDSDGGGTIENSYSVGAVTGVTGATIGGFAGANGSLSNTSASYSTGKVYGSSRPTQGGFVGYDADPGDISDSYWDTETSHIHVRGAGNRKHDPGVTGLTTEQFQSGLPAGFDPATWGENKEINNGFPYLLANPPR